MVENRKTTGLAGIILPKNYTLCTFGKLELSPFLMLLLVRNDHVHSMTVSMENMFLHGGGGLGVNRKTYQNINTVAFEC